MAHSGRALAASAQRAGLSVHVLDLFADEDTFQYTRSVSRVGDCSRGFLSERLESAVERLLAVENIAGIVAGSGFEDRPELLELVCRNRRLLGNEPEVLRAAKDPERFFGLLKRLGIPHPETSRQLPANPAEWLIKRIGGAGGGHIRFPGKDDPFPEGCYVQQFMDGTTYSVVSLANGREAAIIGFSQLWQESGFAEAPFKYGGAMSWRGLEKGLRRQVEEAVQAVVAALELKGLCGMDFIVDGEGRWHVLEVNPRPPATFELHEHQRGLFSDHVLACEGRLPTARSRSFGPPVISAHGVLYAPWTITVPVGVAWPEWTSDRPSPGTRIGQGEPICTVHARDGEEETARRLMKQRLASLRSPLGIFKEAA